MEDMPAYKYSSNSSYNPYIQASVKPKMGKNYTYNGRMYCQVKKQGKISYADTTYNISIRLVSWTVNSIDVELELKSFRIKEEHGLSIDQCENIINSTSVLEGVPIYIRVSNTGRIVKVFNTTDLTDVYGVRTHNEAQIIEHLETTPILSAFLSGQIEQGVKADKVFMSNIFPSLKINSELKIESKKERFNNAKETYISDKRIFFDRDKQEYLAEEIFGAKISKSNIYDFNTLVTSNKGIDRVLAYSTVYSTEETVGSDTSVFISIGMEKVVLEKDIDLPTKVYSTLLRKISVIF